MYRRIIRYIVGTYRVTLKGKDLEKILSGIIKQGIPVKNIERSEGDELSFECYKKTLTKVKPLIDADKNLEYSIQIRGFINILRRYRKRWGIPVGFFLFFAILYITSLFVWDIQITGCTTIGEKEIISVLKDNELYIGALKSRIDASDIENNILYIRDDMSWMSINLKGTTAFIEIRENNRKVKKLDTSKPSNIYASRDGVIASIDDYMGYKVVNVGDTVTAGDLIVSGEYTDKYGNEYKLHSYASIMAYTSHTKEVFVPYETVIHQKTGKTKKYYKINLIRFSLPLYFNKKISYNTYNITESKTKYSLFDSFVFPFSIEKTVYTETQKTTYTRTKEQALNDAYEMLYDYEYSLVGISVTDRNYEITETEDGVNVKVILDCYEDIGVEMEIE